MPENYTPANVDHDVITVPIDGDPASGASLIALKQLADITEFIKGITAIKGADNTFLKTLIVNTAETWEPLIKSTKLASDSSEPGSTWRMLWEVPLITGVMCRAYYGSGTAGDGNFCITINAVYSADTTNKWYADTNTIDSSALFVRANLTWHAFQPAGPASWPYWTAGGTVEAGGFNYIPAKVIAKTISPLDMVHNHVGNPFSGTADYAAFVSGAQGVWVIRAPHGSLLTNTTFKIRGAGGGDSAYTIQLKRRYSINFAIGDTSMPTIAPVDTTSGTLSGTGSAYNEHDLEWGGLTVSKDETYEVFLINNGPGSLIVAGIQYTYTDPGPRNF